jgi:hypothetical protein
MAAASSTMPPAGRRGPAFRLVEDYEAPHIKFQGREPRTLEELALARADYEHRSRVAEIKALAKKLELLQEFLPVLAERGIKLARRRLSSWDSGKTVRIESAIGGTDNALHAALLDLGFKEIERSHLYREEHTVKLQHGRWLVVSFVITVPAGSAG